MTSDFGKLTEGHKPTGLYAVPREPINIAPEVRKRLRGLLLSPAFAGTGVGYSAFIDRACEIAEREWHYERQQESIRRQRHAAEAAPLPHPFDT